MLHINIPLPVDIESAGLDKRARILFRSRRATSHRRIYNRETTKSTA